MQTSWSTEATTFSRSSKAGLLKLFCSATPRQEEFSKRPH